MDSRSVFLFFGFTATPQRTVPEHQLFPNHCLFTSVQERSNVSWGVERTLPTVPSPHQPKILQLTVLFVPHFPLTIKQFATRSCDSVSPIIYPPSGSHRYALISHKPYPFAFQLCDAAAARKGSIARRSAVRRRTVYRATQISIISCFRAHLTMLNVDGVPSAVISLKVASLLTTVFLNLCETAAR